MLERLVAWVLNSYIGDYFGNVNTDQLSVALHQGEVELEGLPLKVEAFRHWDLPIEIKAGFVGKIRLKVPLYRFRTEPWLILMEDLYLVTGPINDFTYHEEFERQIQQDYKLTLLEAFERKFQSQYESRESQSYYAYSYSNWFSYGSSLVSSIIENLQLKINNVHIRYEDSWSIPKTPFACGLVISSINVQTTDDNNDPAEGSPTKSGIARKAVLLESFNIYWDNHITLIDNLSMESLIAHMKLLSERQVDETNGATKDHDYLVYSVNGRAQIKQNAFDDLLKTADNFMLDFQLERFPLRLTLVQYRLMLEWSAFLNRTKKLWKYRRWRPAEPIKGNPKAWWTFAVNANLENYRKKREASSWKFVIQRVKDILDYTDIYYSYLTENDSLTKGMEEIKDRIETELTYDELVCLRETVFHNIKKNQENLSLKRNGGDENGGLVQSWLSWWYSETVESEDAESLDSVALAGETSRLSISWNDEEEENSVAVNIQVPQLTLELVTLGENGSEQSLAKCVMQNFALYFSRHRSFESKVKITLKSLIVEDLLVPDYSNHRFIMSSEVYNSCKKSKDSPERKVDFLSTSCPTTPHEIPFSRLSSHFSLPAKLQKSNIYHLMPYSGSRRPRTKMPLTRKNKVSGEENFASSCPSTPPCSPISDFSDRKLTSKSSILVEDDEENEENHDSDSEDSDNTLVKITFLFVDENSPLFETKYNRNHRFVNIQFNSLETIINPETWAKILNFFEPLPEKRSRYETDSDLDHIGLKAFFLSGPNSPSPTNETGSPKLEVDSKIDLTIRRLSIILNKPEDQPLAKANILGFHCFYSKYHGNVLMEGRLKKLSIVDLTQYNEIYHERFITSGKEALNFTFFKYGQDDTTMRREYDMSLKLKMASVQYVHTQRFYTETMHFLRQFNTLQMKFKALSSPETLMNLHRSTRISLDVKTDAPVIVIPVHHLSENVLVADFGQLTVSNKFLYAGSPGTIGTVCKKSGLTQSDLIAASAREKYGVLTRVSSQSLVSGYVRLLEPKPCLLDVIDVQLPEMDLYSGFVVRKRSDSKTRNQTSKAHADHSDPYDDGVLYFPSFLIKRLPGRMLKERFIFSLQIERNLEAEFNHSLPDISMLGKVSAVRCTIDSPRYQLIRGVLENNLGEPMDHIAQNQPIIEGEGLSILLPNRIWTSMAIHLDLKNVSLEIIDGSMEQFPSSNSFLARIDFLSSRLSIESFTDSSKDIDLVSQEIKIMDTRYSCNPSTRERAPNVFPGILQPTKKGLSSTPFQVEIHYRSKRNHVCLTILLNNMRVMAIFDWFKEMSDFLSQPINFKRVSPTTNASRSPLGPADSSYTSSLLSVDEDRLPDFELKFNITDTELVVVENCSIEDTNAVILKGTAILSLATDLTHPEPFNCTLEGVEVFSCVLGVEEETALSIVDPLNVTIDLALKVIEGQPAQFVADRREEVALVFDLSEISLRLSYKDIFLFLKILNSLPTQTKVLSKSSSSPKHGADPLMGNLNDSVYALPSHISHLQSLGFKPAECVQALEQCKGNINEAAIWLTHSLGSTSPSSLSPDNPIKSPDLMGSTKRANRFSKFNFETISLQVGSCIFCLIDDCKDTDVPLFEVRLAHIDLWQKFSSQLMGAAKFEITGDYFNRSLSGWQPILEKWQTTIGWNLEKDEKEILKKLSVEVKSSDTLNLVLTNTCLELYKSVATTWVDEYNLLSQQNKQPVRQRSPFIPFAIKNESGCDIRFSLVTSNVGEHLTTTLDSSQSIFSINPLTRVKKISASKLPDPSKLKSSTAKDWVLVRANETVPFTFDGPAKARHQDSHRLISHKIVVQVDGWQPVFPVSVDKVGKYFREAKPENVRYETARIVFDITLESNARKLITVRSALMLFNGTSNSMEFKFGTFGNSCLYVMPQTLVPVPLHLIRNKIFARPCDIGVNMCETPIVWENVRRMSDSSSELLTCTPTTITGGQHSSYTSSALYQFVSVVSRENFPLEERSRGPGLKSIRVLPAHQISLLPPLTVSNLLPFELRFRAKGYTLDDSIKPGGTASLQYTDTSREFTISFTMDNYPRCTPLVIVPNFVNDFVAKLEMFDKKDRPLNLLAQISLINGSPFAISITLLSPFWFVNRTGLPLIIKQEAADKEGSGQFEEHEVARSISPLLFSYYEPDSSYACTMRLGKSFGRTRWCNSFYLQKGTTVRKLRIASNDSRRPDKVYEIGIDVRNGKGRYRDTYVVTLSPRYQIENSSSFSLEITQKFATLTESDCRENQISVLPNSNVAFHWPRSDRDRLLCVRLASVPGCHWSGGFSVTANCSFYLNIRDSQGKSHFIRLEIFSQGATSFVIFSDAGNLPSPLRVDNFSEVPIEFYQTNTSQAWMKTTVKPKSSVPYAWDESTLKPHLTVSAPGGCSATYDLNSLRPGDNLSYENFFYIVFTGTFIAIQDAEDEVSVQQYSDQDITSMQLVLDVPEGSRKIIINRKEPGRRSQLWRRDTHRRLLHEGSSPPKDPRKSAKNEGTSFVLDIEAQCAFPGQYSTLTLRNIDNKRSLTQYWNFTPDGRLCCEHPDLYVQPKDGFLGLFIGNEVVLGPTQPITYSKLQNGIPFEQALSTRKMRKGSGLLSVRVCTDGPTRVLQIMDVRNIPPSSSRVALRSSNMPSITSTKSSLTSATEKSKIEFNIVIKPSNVGLSLVNQFNEEIIYLFLHEVVLEYQYKVFEHRINCSVKYFQADNQIIEAEKPIIFHTIELEETNPLSGLPALHIFIHKLILPKVEAQFFEDVQITIKDIALNLEELMMLKFYEFLGYPRPESEAELIHEDSNAHKAITSALTKSPRLYFSNLRIKLDNVKLSVLTSSHLPTKLSLIKKKLRLRLIRFEDAKISLLPFRKNYSLETFKFLIEGIVSHYHRQLKGQAAKILGSFDFLGNPLGFVNDVTDGLSELINEGNVGGLILNLAHGISDSTAKFTSVLSDGLGVVTMDDRHQEIRKRIKHESNDHFKAGFKGLGVGILGGFTSIITQTYEGAVNEGGVGGLFFGFGKGILGTITKPAVGILDFATSTAIAVRDSSRRIANTPWSQVKRIRPPRQRFSVHGPGSLLPHYSLDQSRAQEFFYKSTLLNDKDNDELFISFKMLRSDAALFITSHKLHLITWTETPEDRGKGQISLSFEFLLRCETTTQVTSPTGTLLPRSYLILVVTDESCPQCYGNYYQLAELGSTKPKIRCQSEQLALEATQYIDFAKASYEENHFIILS